MANRRPQNGGRRPDFGRNDRGKNFRGGVSPWQGGGPGGGLPNLLPLAGNSTEATLALASNIINLLQPRQAPVPSLLDMPIRRDFGPNMGRFDRGYGPNRMGNQNFRRTGNYNRAGERINMNRKPFKPNDGPRQQNKSSPKKEADSKAKPVKESEQDEKKDGDADKTENKEEEKETKKEPPKTRYDDINPQLLKCHICNKSMWDGRSFENHLNGRAHAILMQKTAECYALTADTMRQEFKIREMKRTRKAGVQPARDFYCAMCDMYAADGAAHRTTLGHRKLKKYLHPTCTGCHKEMPTRIELDEHRLTAEHLRNFQEKQDVIAKPKPEVMLLSTLSMEQCYLRDDRQRRQRRERDRDGQHDDKDGDEKEKDDIKEEKDKSEDDIKKEKDTEDEGKEGEEDKKPAVIDAENTIVDFKEGEDLTGVAQDQFPAYSSARGVGRSFLTEFRCVQCTLCRKLLDSDETAEVHLRTWRHHLLFIRMLAEKSGQNQDGQKRSIDNAEESGSKRRKTDSAAEANGDVAKEMASAGDADGDNEEDVKMPPAEELEDWEQSIDEILNDEGRNDDEDMKDVKEEQVDTEPAQEPEKEPVPEDRPKSGPRGRGRGRRNY